MTVAPSLAPPEFEWRLSFTCEKHPVDVACHELPESSKVPVMFGPNISGNLGMAVTDWPPTGMFAAGAGLDVKTAGAKWGETLCATKGDAWASRSNSIYGSSSGVQPSSMTALVLIKF